MAKVYQVTLMLEVTDDTPHPEDWNWHPVVEQIVGLDGFSVVRMEQRPFLSMEDDPANHTTH